MANPIPIDCDVAVVVVADWMVDVLSSLRWTRYHHQDRHWFGTRVATQKALLFSRLLFWWGGGLVLGRLLTGTCTMEMTWRSFFLHILQFCMLKTFVKPSQVRALSTMRSSFGGLPAANALANIRVAPVVDGAIAGETFNAQDLWSEGPTMVYVVRRPG